MFIYIGYTNGQWYLKVTHARIHLSGCLQSETRKTTSPSPYGQAPIPSWALHVWPYQTTSCMCAQPQDRASLPSWSQVIGLVFLIDHWQGFYNLRTIKTIVWGKSDKLVCHLLGSDQQYTTMTPPYDQWFPIILEMSNYIFMPWVIYYILYYK